MVSISQQQNRQMLCCACSLLFSHTRHCRLSSVANAKSIRLFVSSMEQQEKFTELWRQQAAAAKKKLIFIFSIRIAGLLRNLSRPHRERSLLWNTELGNSFTILPQPEQKSSRCKVVTQQNTLKNRVFVNHSSKLWRSRKHIRSRSRVWSFSGVNTMSELCSPKEKKNCIDPRRQLEAKRWKYLCKNRLIKLPQECVLRCNR